MFGGSSRLGLPSTTLGSVPSQLNYSAFAGGPILNSKVVTELHDMFNRVDINSQGRVVNHVIGNLEVILDAVLGRAPLATYLEEDRTFRGIFANKRPEIRPEDKVYELLSPNSSYSVFQAILDGSRYRRDDYRLDFKYLPPHTRHYLVSPEGAEYRKSFLPGLTQRNQVLLKNGILLLSPIEYFFMRFLSNLVAIGDYKDPELEPEKPIQDRYRNIYHKLFNEYLQFLDEDPRATGLISLFSSLASEYLVVPICISSLGMPRQVKEEVVQQVSDLIVLYTSDLLFQKARSFKTEKTMSYDPRLVRRSLPNYAEQDFRDYCSKLSVFCKNLLFESPFEGRVSFVAIIDLLKTLVDPLRLHGPGKALEEFPNKKAFEDAYLKASFPHVSTIMQLIVVAMNNSVGMLDESDLAALNELLGSSLVTQAYFVPEGGLSQQKIYYGDIEMRKAIEAIELSKVDNKRGPLEAIYNKSEPVKRHAAALAEVVRVRFPSLGVTPSERLYTVFEAPVLPVSDQQSASGRRYTGSYRNKPLQAAKTGLFDSEPLA